MLEGVQFHYPSYPVVVGIMFFVISCSPLTMEGKDKCSDKSGLHNYILEILQVVTKIFKLNLLIIDSIWMHISIGNDNG
jgi:hypothetical protein